MTDDELIEKMARAHDAVEAQQRSDVSAWFGHEPDDFLIYHDLAIFRADRMDAMRAAITALREAGYEVRRKVSYDLEKAFAYPDPPMPEVKKGDVVKMPDTFRFPYGVVDDGGEA